MYSYEKVDVTVVSNSLGSGDWIHIKEGDSTIFEGHSIRVDDLVFLLSRYANVILHEIDDEAIEEGNY